MVAERVKDGAGDLEIFESVGAVGAEDGLLVAFAEEKDEVTRLGFFKGKPDSFFAVHFLKEVFIHDFAFFFGARDKAGGDFCWVFVTRIIFGNDNDIRIVRQNAATNWASGRVAAAGATMNGYNSPFMRGDAVKNFLESIGSVGVINNHCEGLAFVDNIHTAFDASEGSNTILDLGLGEAELATNGGGGEGIHDVKFARNLGGNGKILV